VSLKFGQRNSAQAVETTDVFSPKFDAHGLIPAIVQDASSNEIIMLAFMNAQALEKTIITGTAHYWSRSRQQLWLKGETSGQTQQIVEMKTDCDQDVILLKVKVQGLGATCHTGKRACFYRQIDTSGLNADNTVGLKDIGGKPLFDPAEVYKKG